MSDPRIIEIGEVPLMRQAFPDTTEFFATGPERPDDLGPNDRQVSLATLGHVRRRLASRDVDVVVVHVAPNSEAERAGILVGDVIVAVDGEAALDMHQARRHLNGPDGSAVIVELWRAGCIAAPLYTPLSPSYPLQLGQALGEIRPDLLHLHMPNPSCFAALLSPRARALPWIVHWHADVSADMPDWRVRAAYRERAVLRQL